MQRLGSRFAFTLLVVLALMPAATASAFEYTPLTTQAALKQADAAAQAPWILGGAIVLAGVAIGAGIYFAGRSRRPE